jgi:quercetin dioxygenase-like cupin family protein
MNPKLPYTIDNGHGESITFKEIIREADGDKLLLEGRCKPGSGPAMHVHYKQDESITVMSGSLTYKILGQEPVLIKEGETVKFLRNVPHSFWNSGEGELILSGWVKPVNTIVFFLTALFDAQKRGSNKRPEAYDAAYLMMRYKSEYGLPELPGFVKNVIIPTTYKLGKLLGKYDKFKDAPEPM